MPGSGETREAMALTARAIDALMPEDEPCRVPDQRCKGLGLRVAPGALRLGTWPIASGARARWEASLAGLKTLGSNGRASAHTN